MPSSARNNTEYRCS